MRTRWIRVETPEDVSASELWAVLQHALCDLSIHSLPLLGSIDHRGIVLDGSRAVAIHKLLRDARVVNVFKRARTPRRPGTTVVFQAPPF